LTQKPPKTVAGFDISIEKIINWAKDSTGEGDEKVGIPIQKQKNDVLATEDERIDVVKNFQDVLIAKLKDKFPVEDWIYGEDSERNINISLRKKSWSEETEMGIFDYDSSRMHFATRYNWTGYYKDVYMLMRRDFGGRYNKWNWYSQLKDPYNKWDETNAGISAFKDKDEGFIKYAVDSLCTIATKFDEIITVYEKILQLKNKIPKSELMSSDPWIYESSCLVYDYRVKEKAIASDTYLSNDEGWQIQLFGRDDDSANYLYSLLEDQSIRKEFKVFKPKERLIYQYFSSNSDIEEVRKSLQNLLNGVEAIIKTEPNKI
jgi:hypothetical protein